MLPWQSLWFSTHPDGGFKMFTIKAKFLKSRDTKLVVMILLHWSYGCPQHLGGQGGNWFGGRIHAVNDSLELFVGEGGTAMVPLDYPRIIIHIYGVFMLEKYASMYFQIHLD